MSAYQCQSTHQRQPTHQRVFLVVEAIWQGLVSVEELPDHHHDLLDFIFGRITMHMPFDLQACPELYKLYCERVPPVVSFDRSTSRIEEIDSINNGDIGRINNGDIGSICHRGNVDRRVSFDHNDHDESTYEIDDSNDDNDNDGDESNDESEPNNKQIVNSRFLRHAHGFYYYRCEHPDCEHRALYGPSNRLRTHCKKHCPRGYVRSSSGNHCFCGNYAWYAPLGELPIYCRKHAVPGCVLRGKECWHAGCTTVASLAVRGNTYACCIAHYPTEEQLPVALPEIRRIRDLRGVRNHQPIQHARAPRCANGVYSARTMRRRVYDMQQSSLVPRVLRSAHSTC
jgi:hypothetical protein